LEQLVQSVTCNECEEVLKSLAGWRSHCLTHADLQGFVPSLVNSECRRTPADFVASKDNPFSCPRCNLCFASREEMEEHHKSITRTVRLVCPQCKGQFSDLENHIQEEHIGCVECGFCGLQTLQLISHCHTLHSGFESVIAESTTRCFGDGITSEWLETVLQSSAQFLASEVKPEAAQTKPQRTVSKPNNAEFNPVMPPAAILNNKSNPVMPPAAILNNKFKLEDSLQEKLPSRTHPISNLGKNDIRYDMSEEQRSRKNVQDYKRLNSMMMGEARARNECEICGFIPYTKNKYREKQDHLAKMHFKERIDVLIPTTRPYACPYTSCAYQGRDRQDILRHYTGKHNILKMWVDEFVREQILMDKEAAAALLPSTELTFQEMQLLAIEKQDGSMSAVDFRQMERQAIEKEMGPAGRTSISLKRRQSISPILREEPADYNTFNLQHDQLTLLDASPPSSGAKKSAKSPHDSLTGSAVNELLNGSATAAGTVIIDTPSGQISFTRSKRKPSKDITETTHTVSKSCTKSPLYLFRCDICPDSVVFKSMQGLREHKASDHIKDEVEAVDPLALDTAVSIPETEGNYSTQNKRTCSTGTEFSDPTRTEFSDPTRTEFSDPTGTEGSCPTCQMNFNTAKALRLHQSICSDGLAATSTIVSSKFLPAIARAKGTPAPTAVMAATAAIKRTAAATTSSMEPPKKKAKRPPPPLVKL